MEVQKKVGTCKNSNRSFTIAMYHLPAGNFCVWKNFSMDIHNDLKIIFKVISLGKIDEEKLSRSPSVPLKSKHLI